MARRCICNRLFDRGTDEWKTCSQACSGERRRARARKRNHEVAARLAKQKADAELAAQKLEADLVAMDQDSVDKSEIENEESEENDTCEF